MNGFVIVYAVMIFIVFCNNNVSGFNGINGVFNHERNISGDVYVNFAGVMYMWGGMSHW